ncbi:MAG TPA: MFS transporter [Candidatus Binataceae bacterium]|nr:MFS transporter [Candidatus Binataceae bacterium]
MSRAGRAAGEDYGIFANRWWVVVASAFGLIVSAGPINIFAFGVFLKPVSQALGISRGLLGSALLITTAVGTLANPVVGALVDRFGPRRVLMPGIALYAMGVASYSLMTSSAAMIYLLFALSGVFGGAQSPVPYAAVVSKWFDHERGLALGVAMGGVGVGAAVVPQLTALLISHYGWREAFVWLGVCMLLIAWVPVAIFVREPAAYGTARAAKRRSPDLPGVSARDAILHSWRFWALTVAFFLGVAAINGTLSQLVPLLTDRGMSMQAAASILGVAGLALIAGRVISGWCLDRFFGPYVSICFYLFPIAGIALLGRGSGGLVPIVGTLLCGLAVGAEVNLMAFLVTRYFGLKAYGTIYGVMFGFFAGANGVGPFLATHSYNWYHSYGPAFVWFQAALLVAIALFAPLGPYRYPAGQSMPALEEGAAAVPT